MKLRLVYKILIGLFSIFVIQSKTLYSKTIDNYESVVVEKKSKENILEGKIVNNKETKMSLEDILEFTFKNNDILNAEREKTKAVEIQKFKTIGANVLPTIGIDLNYGYSDFKQRFDILNFKDNGLVENNRIYLQEPIFKSGRTITKVKAVNNQIAIQQNQLNQKEQEILFNTIQATISLLQAREILAITIKNEESLKKNYEYIKGKRSVGRATMSDLSLAEARYSSAKSDTISATATLLNGRSLFFKITKIDSNLIDVDYEVLFKTSFYYNINFDKVLETALLKNPSYQMAKNSYEMNKNNLRFAKTNFLPEVYLNAEWGRNQTTDIMSQTAGSVGVNVKIPLFQSGVEYASHIEAGHLLNESKFTLNDVKDSLVQQTMSTFDDFLSSKSLIVSGKSYRDAARMALNSTIAEEMVGKATLVDILDRRREYFDTEIMFLKYKMNVVAYYYSLRVLMGELNLVDLFIY